MSVLSIRRASDSFTNRFMEFMKIYNEEDEINWVKFYAKEESNNESNTKLEFSKMEIKIIMKESLLSKYIK